MTKQNPYVIPKENYKKVEIVQELKNEGAVLSYEEFLKTYEGNVNYADLENSDISVDKSYGPGNEQSKTVAKVASGIGVAAVTAFCPPVGIIVGTGVAFEGATLAIGGAVYGEEDTTNFGLEMIGIGVTAGVIPGSVATSSSSNVKASCNCCSKKK